MVKKSARGGSASGGKHPIYRLHKIKVHNNRWLIWSLAYALVVSIALVGYVSVSEENIQSQSAENQYQPWHSYKDSRLGFSLSYPADWSIEADDSSSISFIPTNSADLGVSIFVGAPSVETSIRSSLRNVEESRTFVDGHNSAKVKNDLGNGHYETVVMSLRNQKLYVIRGTNSLVQKLLLTFHFTP